MDLFKRLLMMKQIRFVEGEISLFNERVVISPKDTLVAITKFMNKHPEVIPEIYEDIRNSFEKGWALEAKKRYGFKETRDYFKWLIDLSNIAGWGKSELVSFDSKKIEGKFKTYNSLIGSFYKNKLDSPVDHIWRGLTAGGLTKVFERDIDWFEIKCIAKGDPYCEFIFKTRESFKKESDENIKKQLPL